ncbi:MAG: 4Fe-4S binding protein [Eubacterium sp.]|nr:4Fe-4S binding protein [Eubacterium sp.]
MREDYLFVETELQPLYNTILEKQRDGWRLAQICATAYEGGNELIYSLAKGYKFENYKVKVPIDTQINSISDFYPSAMLFENEMKELFGVKIKSINVDYKNKFYRIANTTPFKKEVKIIKEDSTETSQNEAASSGGKIVNDMSKCILCGLCARQCPAQSIEVDRKENKTWSINRDTCIGCGACIDACARFKALSFAKNDGESGIVTFKKEA